MMLMLVDVADPRYGGAPDPDDERRRRWRPIDRRVSLPFLGVFSCLVAASADASPEVAYGATLAAMGLCVVGARAALREAGRRAASGEERGGGESPG